MKLLPTGQNPTSIPPIKQNPPQGIEPEKCTNDPSADANEATYAALIGAGIVSSAFVAIVFGMKCLGIEPSKGQPNIDINPPAVVQTIDK